MKASQFSTGQLSTILDQAEQGEQTVGAICREHGMTDPLFAP